MSETIAISPPAKPTPNSWPRNTTKSVDTRKCDLVIRITNWLKDKEEPAYDVECYIAGVYDWNESKSFCLSSGKSAEECRLMAIEFAQRQIAKHIDATKPQ